MSLLRQLRTLHVQPIIFPSPMACKRLPHVAQYRYLPRHQSAVRAPLPIVAPVVDAGSIIMRFRQARGPGTDGAHQAAFGCGDPSGRREMALALIVLLVLLFFGTRLLDQERRP